MKPLLDRDGRWVAWLAGMVAGNVVSVMLYAGVMALLMMPGMRPFQRAAAMAVSPSFILIPLAGGVVASYCWRRVNPGVGAIVLGSLGVTLLGLGGASLVFREGIICLLIVFPLYFAMILAGALIGRIAFKSDPTRLRLCIVPLIALFALGEALVRRDHQGLVEDRLVIAAPPEAVWPRVTAFPEIPARPAFWMFRLGLPYPVATTSFGGFVGAERRCIFSAGMEFGERVVQWLPGRELTFDIVELPQHPELIGHITPWRGQFALHDNGDGTTTLIGRTWYRLHVRPAWYFQWWTEHIFRAVHLRVMEDIKKRAEAG